MSQNDASDEFAGQGGSYVIGKDGKRKLVERTQIEDPQPQAQAAPADAEATLPPTAKSKAKE
jgi:hypothetical protein